MIVLICQLGNKCKYDACTIFLPSLRWKWCLKGFRKWVLGRGALGSVEKRIIHKVVNTTPLIGFASSRFVSRRPPLKPNRTALENLKDSLSGWERDGVLPLYAARRREKQIETEGSVDSCTCLPLPSSPPPYTPSSVVPTWTFKEE